MSAHAFLAPSSAHRWRFCALSASLEAAYPEAENSLASLEGTAAHWVVQMRLQGTPVSEGVQAPNGVAVTDVMLEAAELMLEDIYKTLGPDWAQFLVVERRVHMPRVHPTHNWGTPDYRAWLRMTNGGLKLVIWDFKFGYDIVEAPENWQLIDYAEGCLHEAGVDGLQDQQIAVDLRVIQPRAPHRQGPVRSWPVRASDLRPYINQLANAAGAAMQPNPVATPTPSACKNCKGRHACEALQRASFAAADQGGRYGAFEMTSHMVGLELRELTRARELLDARVSGLEAQATAAIKAGQVVPFWMLDSVPGRLAWAKPASEVFALGDMLGVQFRKEPEPMTPTQAKDAAKKAARAAGLPADTYEALFKGYAERPAGAVKLVADDGKKWRLTFGNT